ncbi:MAG: tRNA uridine-5-carboxymethylaminomethyl(34) synthesis GTPase MnmE [Candidatus Omnitrophica bacterium]|nr:tRNA uridine-5-carboxymethylaminomethyl(34) synthesis GTPase MnmE [Candidatus Omnitrophota bacterium]
MISTQISDTIVAISTPLGQGGIGIVRLSGSKAFKIGDEIFRSKRGEKKVSKLPSFSVHYGYIVSDSKLKAKKQTQGIIDEVIISVMRAPQTYTKENVLEINCHGGIVALRKILELCINQGARLAQPGEFTQRAFQNGRIDLIQAESVLNVINAKTDLALEPAMHQLQGKLSNHIKNLMSKLVEIVAPLEASIDFPDDTIQRMTKKNIVKSLNSVSLDIRKLVDSADKGIMLANGLNIALAGAANVGKSSIMNALLEYERVIVTNISGTTRDVVEEVLNMRGVAVKISDTAGIMDSSCVITQESMNRSLACLERSDLVLWVIDGSRKIQKADLAVAKKIAGRKAIIVVNKNDLSLKVDLAQIKKNMPDAAIVKISALKKQGLDSLEKTIINMFFKGQIVGKDEFIISNIRQKQALEDCYKNIQAALGVVTEKGYEECLVFEIRQALDFLGQVVGDNITEDILSNIFSRFCIGK